MKTILLLNINNKYKDTNGRNLYEITRGHWCVNKEKVKDIKFACAVVKGEIQEVFEIKKWGPCEDSPKRKVFSGNLASNDIRSNLIGKNVKEYWKKGSQNPVKYAYLEDIQIK